jgi:hypothetical protein
MAVDAARAPECAMERAERALRRSVQRWRLLRLERVEEKENVQCDARGRIFPDGETTKLLPTGEPGVALELAVTEGDDLPSTRKRGAVHELRVAVIDVERMKTTVKFTAEQQLAFVATLATMDLVVLASVHGDDEQATAFARALQHHSNDCFDYTFLPTATFIFRRLALVRDAPTEVVFVDAGFTSCSSLRNLTVRVDDGAPGAIAISTTCGRERRAIGEFVSLATGAVHEAQEIAIGADEKRASPFVAMKIHDRAATPRT